MAIDAGIAACSEKPIAFPWDGAVSMLQLRRHAKINNVQHVSLLPRAEKKILRLDIAMQKTLVVDKGEAREGLVGKQEDRLEGEATTAVIQEIAQCRAE